LSIAFKQINKSFKTEDEYA